MEFEKELIWTAYIWKNKRFINNSQLCKKDFERMVKAPTDNKKFARWFLSLLCKNIIFPSEQIHNGIGIKKVYAYKVNYKLLENYIEQFPEYKIVSEFCKRDIYLRI